MIKGILFFILYVFVCYQGGIKFSILFTFVLLALFYMIFKIYDVDDYVDRLS